jgi:phage pi2 protein 07
MVNYMKMSTKKGYEEIQEQNIIGWNMNCLFAKVENQKSETLAKSKFQNKDCQTFNLNFFVIIFIVTNKSIYIC